MQFIVEADADQQSQPMKCRSLDLKHSSILKAELAHGALQVKHWWLIK
jgi:hypothetical protein